jgi:hypothetical protein
MTHSRRLVLIRHGTSALVERGWFTAAEFRGWLARYEATGIRVTERAPDELKRRVIDANLVVSSDAPRALETAQLLAPVCTIEVSPLLRELRLPIPSMRGISLPLTAWAIVVGVNALAHQAIGRYPTTADAIRLDNAAEWIAACAIQHACTVIVTHAAARRELASRLVEKHWHRDPGPRALRPWSAWWFTLTAQDSHA